jgi:hypothetical protein
MKCQHLLDCTDCAVHKPRLRTAIAELATAEYYIGRESAGNDFPRRRFPLFQLPTSPLRKPGRTLFLSSTSKHQPAAGVPMAAKLKLTQQILDNPPPLPPDKAKLEWRDPRLPGLYARQGKSPVMSFYYQDKNPEGLSRHTKLGTTIEMKLVDARNAAKILRAEVALGRDPQAEARARRASISWNKFFEDSYLPYVKAHNRTWKNAESLQRNWISPRFGKTKLNRISRSDFEKLHREMREQGRAESTCNHILKMKRAALNYAVDLQQLQANPLLKVRAFTEDNEVQR